MSGISTLNGAHGSGGPLQLAQQLEQIASGAERAARAAEGDYINPPTLRDLQRADKNVGRAIAQLEDLMPQIAVHGGGDDGLRAAMQAARNLEDGREVLRAGVAVEDDVLRSGAAVIDQVATGSASAFFDQAAFSVRGLADGVKLNATPLDDIFRAITAVR